MALHPIGALTRAGPRARPLDGGRGGWLGGLYSPQPPAPAYPPPGVFQINGRIFIKVMAAGTFASSVADGVAVACVIPHAGGKIGCRRGDRGVIPHAGGEIGRRCGFRVVASFAMQAERLCAGMVAVCMGFAR